jgi:hypothetical protein
VSAAAYSTTFGFEVLHVHRDVAAVAIGETMLTLAREEIPSGRPILRRMVVSMNDTRLGAAECTRGPDGTPIEIVTSDSPIVGSP